VPRIAPTFAALHVGADELPAGFAFEKELACVSPQTRSLFEDDIYSQILPKAKRQDFQTIAGPKAKGSLLYFDWGDQIPEAAEQFIPGLLFGEKEQSTEMHPEQIIRIGGIMVILSFPLRCDERQFVIRRLRTRFGVRTTHALGPLKDAIVTLNNAAGKGGDVKAGLDYATAHQDELAGSSFAALLEGELATAAEQWERAEKAYGRALALDAATDPLESDGLAWSARDGHGTALYELKHYDEALRELTAAAAEAAALKRPQQQGHSLYNAACCLALLKRGDAAIATLKRSLELDSSEKAHAAEDEDFQALRERPDFKALVK
jgi:tetratricopeptide (TPR) repeat protein